MIRSLPLCSCLLLVGCAHFWTPPPEVPFEMAASDARRALVGTWYLTMTVDSVDPNPVPPPLPPRRTARRFRITDSLATPRFPEVLAFMSPDSTSASADTVRLRLAQKGEHWQIQFWPGITDNYFGMGGVLAGDSLTGRWSRYSWGRLRAAGQFVMLHAAR